jgi:cytochrome c553
MRAFEKGISEEILPVFRSPVFRSLSVAAVLLCAIGAPALAQQSSAPPAPLLPITLAGDAERGAVVGQTCTGCHGIPGYYNANPAYHVPKLGGQNADYLEIALQGYRRGTRGHETMQAQASSLSDQDIADVAAYFESFAGDAETGRTRASAQKIEAGRAKASTCVACHGPEGVAAAPQWPNLAGQHETYLLVALEHYKDGARVDLVMNPLMAPLDDQSIEELAAFFAAQPHLYSTEP